jgi:hypothetical protein
MSDVEKNHTESYDLRAEAALPTPPHALTAPTFAEVVMANDSPNTGRMRGQRASLNERFWQKVSPEPNSGCWLWDGSQQALGYGRFYKNGRAEYAHRVSYELHVGPIPIGLSIDHLCRNPSCVNPAHLEAVTHAENVRRGIAGDSTGAMQRAKTHCPSGHAYTEDNIYYTVSGHRSCRTCSKTASLARYYKRPPLSEEHRERVRLYKRDWARQKRAKHVP